MTFDILIKNAKTRWAQNKFVSIAIKDGKIHSIDENIAENAHSIIDAQGNLVTESFVNGHLHLCKAYTLEKVGEEALTSYQGEGMGKAMTAIDLASGLELVFELFG